MRWWASELIGNERGDVDSSADVDGAFGVVPFVFVAASAFLYGTVFGLTSVRQRGDKRCKQKQIWLRW